MYRASASVESARQASALLGRPHGPVMAREGEPGRLEVHEQDAAFGAEGRPENSVVPFGERTHHQTVRTWPPGSTADQFSFSQSGRSRAGRDGNGQLHRGVRAAVRRGRGSRGRRVRPPWRYPPDQPVYLTDGPSAQPCLLVWI